MSHLDIGRPFYSHPRILQLIDKYKKGEKLTDEELILLLNLSSWVHMNNAEDLLRDMNANLQVISRNVNDIHDIIRSYKPLLDVLLARLLGESEQGS